MSGVASAAGNGAFLQKLQHPFLIVRRRIVYCVSVTLIQIQLNVGFSPQIVQNFFCRLRAEDLIREAGKLLE